jgi:hypothetical protein
MDDRKVFIYALIDSRNGCIFYVGSTVNVKARRMGHKGVFSSGQSLRQRLAEIESAGAKSEFVILGEATHQDRDKQEWQWIEKIRNDGYELLNKRKPSSSKQADAVRLSIANKRRRHDERIRMLIESTK